MTPSSRPSITPVRAAYTAAWAVVALVMAWYVHMGPQWWDFDGQWAISQHLCHGADPYLPAPPDAVDHLAPIPQGWGTSPWGLVLGQVFYPGWLSLSRARAYYIIMYMGLYVVAAVVLCRQCRCRKRAMLLAGLGSVGYLWPMLMGNAGGMMALMAVGALALRHRHPYMAGVLLAMAMVKPQMALPLCLYLLLTRHLRLLATAAAVDVAAWGVASLVLHRMPWTLLGEFAHASIGSPDMYVGLLTPLAPLLPHPSMAMYLGMALALTYAVALHYTLRRQGEMAQLLAWCVTAAVWCYSWGNEFAILLPVLACLLPHCLAYGEATAPRCPTGEQWWLALMLLLYVACAAPLAHLAGAALALLMPTAMPAMGMWLYCLTLLPLPLLLSRDNSSVIGAK